MRQIFTQFGGVVPRIDNDRKLPSYSATRARDVDMTSGSLVPMTQDPPFQSLHNTDDGTLKAGIPWGDVISIDPPSQVTLAEKITMTLPDQWFDVQHHYSHTELTIPRCGHGPDNFCQGDRGHVIDLD